MRVYHPNPKREGMVIRGPVDAAPMDLTPEQASELLNHPVYCRQVPGKRQFIGVRDGKIYVFQEDNAGGYHGYRITGNELYSKYPSVAPWGANLLEVNVKRLSRME